MLILGSDQFKGIPRAPEGWKKPGRSCKLKGGWCPTAKA